MTVANAAETTPPERSHEQRMAALQHANMIRSRRARFKRNLVRSADPRLDLVLVLVQVPDWIASARMFDLLLALPGLGRVRANRLLTRERVSPSKTVGGLSERQRNAFVDDLQRLPMTPGGRVSLESL